MYKILEGCPRCGQYQVRISHVRGPLEWLRRKLTGRRPHRCIACGWRGWANESHDRRYRTDPGKAQQRRRADDQPPTKTSR